MYVVKLPFLVIDLVIIRVTTKRRFHVFLPLDFSFFLSVTFFPCFVYSTSTDKVFAFLEERSHTKVRKKNSKKKKPRKSDLKFSFEFNNDREPALHSTGSKNIPYSLFCFMPKWRSLPKTCSRSKHNNTVWDISRLEYNGIRIRLIEYQNQQNSIE